MTRRSAATFALAAMLSSCGGGGGEPGVPLGDVPASTDVPAGCGAARRVAVEGSSHVAPPQRVAYRTNPPTSGGHYSLRGVAPAASGVYSEAPSDESLVHNLEHGHVILWYAPDLDKGSVDALAQVVNREPRYRLLVPRAGMPFRIAFTAWSVIQGCATPAAAVADAAEEFARRFQQKAPENVPGRPSV